MGVIKEQKKIIEERQIKDNTVVNKMIQKELAQQNFDNQEAIDAKNELESVGWNLTNYKTYEDIMNIQQKGINASIIQGEKIVDIIPKFKTTHFKLITDS